MFLDIKDVLTNNYDDKKSNDVALVELKDRFQWSVVALPACLAKADYVEKYKSVLMVSFALR